jgi:hypothetical protein
MKNGKTLAFGLLTLSIIVFLTEQSACGIPGQRLQKRESSAGAVWEVKNETENFSA